MMENAYICDAIRTPFGRYGGKLASIRTDDLAAIPLKALVERNASVDWNALDDVVYGCANQAGEDNRNVARMALLLAGLPKRVPACRGTPAARPQQPAAADQVLHEADGGGEQGKGHKGRGIRGERGCADSTCRGPATRAGFARGGRGGPCGLPETAAAFAFAGGGEGAGPPAG